MGALRGEDPSISAADVDGVSKVGEEKPFPDRPYTVEFVEADVCSVLVEPGEECLVECRSRGSTVAVGTFLISLLSNVNWILLVRF